MRSDCTGSRKQVKFVKPYFKLSREEFTTVRGKTWFKRYAEGDVVLIEAPGVRFAARVVKVELRRVGDMTLDFVKADADSPGHEMTSVQCFVDLLNSFRARYWTQVTLDSVVTVITLMKVSNEDTP